MHKATHKQGKNRIIPWLNYINQGSNKSSSVGQLTTNFREIFMNFGAINN
jgi:hypothetical protein